MVRVIEQPYVPQHLINYARYTEAVTLFKTANDPVWCASALEGLATVALLEASGQGFGACSTRHLTSIVVALTNKRAQHPSTNPEQRTLGVTFPKSLEQAISLFYAETRSFVRSLESTL